MEKAIEFILLGFAGAYLIIFLLPVITGGCHSHPINRSRVESFLDELESGLARYHIEYGIWPPNPPKGEDWLSRETAGVQGAAVLYQHLSGDFDLDGRLFQDDGTRDPGDEGSPVYVHRLDWESNRDAMDKRCAPNPEGPGYIVIDCHGDQIRYLSDSPFEGEKLTINPDYDLWSIFDTRPSKAGDPETRSKYITNWSR